MFFNIYNRKYKTGILMGALFIFIICSYGQTKSTSASNKSKTNTDATDDSIHVKEYNISNSKVATISSAIIPGLGQAYNKKYWKIPIIYGTGSILYYFYDRNNYYYQRCLVALNTPEDEAIKDKDLAVMDKGTLEANRDNFRRNRDLMVIFMGILYTANIVDALVDSHMAEYDISKDLSLKVSPTLLQPAPDVYTTSIGLKIGLRF